MSYPVRSARQRIQAEHTAVVEGVDHVATQIAKPWDTARTTDRDAVVDGLHNGLEMAGLLEYLPRVLADVVEAIGCELRAQPVAAPPYVVVTSRGPILRATIDPGRLLIRFDAFEVVRNCDPRQPPAYRRQDGVRVHVSLE